MKELLANLAIAYLRRIKYSVIIGYKVEGKIYSLNRQSRLYDNELRGEYYLTNGERLDVPTGKFKISQKEESQ
jgi:hypothetical protein